MENNVSTNSERRKIENNLLLYERQYFNKIPFFLTFITQQGLIVTIVSYFATKNLIDFGAVALFFNFIVYKFLAPRWVEVEDVYLIKLYFIALNKIKQFSHKKPKKLKGIKR